MASPPKPSAAPEAPTQTTSSGEPSQSEPRGTSPSGILPAEHWTQQEAPPPDNDADSALGVDFASSTASITSTILQYRTIQGRSFHSEHSGGQYWAANDEKQSELLDINHYVITLALGHKLYLAPLEPEKIKSVLDVGCGTGLWAIDFSDEFPQAEVVGTDLSPIQPTWVPPNLKFEIEDCTQSWTFRDDSMDFVHIRWLIGSIKDWDALMAEAYRVCKPGGWVQSLEPSGNMASDDGTVPEGSALDQWGKFFIEGGKKIGASFTVYEDELQRKGIKAAGFTDIGEHTFKVPIGAWPKDPEMQEMGRFTQHNTESDTEGLMVFIGQTLGWSNEEIQVYLAHMRREVRSGQYHAYFRQRVVWGRKPL